MSVKDTEVAATVVTQPIVSSRHRLRLRPPTAFLLLLPSFLITFVFVYVFIAYTVGVSLSEKWRPAVPDFGVSDPWYGIYDNLMHTARFQADLRNSIVFTVLFLLLSVIAGFIFAILVHNGLWARGFFRGVFLLPYALSFIVTGVVWRWLFNPEYGINYVLRISGVSGAYESAAGHPLQPDWTTSPTVVGDISVLLEKVVPGGDLIQVKLGIPLALLAVVLAASWQLMGFAMAMFLAGLASIPDDVLEASKLDGASGFQYYRAIVLPMIAPFAVTTLVILAHVAFKMFDLVYAMSGSGIGFATDMPGIFVYDTMYKALQPNLGAAAAIVMLVMVCLVIVPYLIKTSKREAHD